MTYELIREIKIKNPDGILRDYHIGDWKNQMEIIVHKDTTSKMIVKECVIHDFTRPSPFCTKLVTLEHEEYGRLTEDQFMQIVEDFCTQELNKL